MAGTKERSLKVHRMVHLPILVFVVEEEDTLRHLTVDIYPNKIVECSCGNMSGKCEHIEAVKQDAPWLIKLFMDSDSEWTIPP